MIYNIKSLKKAFILSSCLASLFSFVGCNEYKFINQWDEGLTRHALSPVYPPRTDFQIGDVYLLQGNLYEKSSDENPPNSKYLNNLILSTYQQPCSTVDIACNLSRDVEQYFKNRVSMPTTEKKVEFDINSAHDEPSLCKDSVTNNTTTVKLNKTTTVTTSQNQNITNENSENATVASANTHCNDELPRPDARLKYSFQNGALPTIVIKNVNSSAIAAVFPINLIKAGLGFGWTRLKDIHITYDDVRTVIIPDSILTNNIEILKTYTASPPDNNKSEVFFLQRITNMSLPALFDNVTPRNTHCKNSAHIEISCLVRGEENPLAESKEADFYLVIPTAVYYAKPFHVNIVNSHGDYLKGTASLPIPQITKTLQKDPGQKPKKTYLRTQTNASAKQNVPPPNTSGAIDKNDLISISDEQLRALLQDTIDTTLSDSFYGGQIKNINTSTNGVMLIGDFKAPIAIAYKAYIYSFTVSKNKSGDFIITQHKLIKGGPISQIMQNEQNGGIYN